MGSTGKGKNKSAHKNFTEKVKEFKEALNEDLEGEMPEIEIIDETVAEPEPVDTDKLVAELNEAKALSVDYLDKLRRSMAEFDNFRKRTAKEKASMYDEGIKDLAEKLIPVLDNFELALKAASDTEDNFYKGVEMILRQFQTVLFDAGLTEIPALGCQFDPNEHNAVAHISDATFNENEIIEEMRKGYKYKDKVIRPSMVRVAN